tara:strand:+ start:981 stop:1253 length:273 start_codon:yes stop_codon:yes gene_type:complete
MNNTLISLDPCKFKILITLVNYIKNSAYEEDDYYLYLLHEANYNGKVDKNFDDLEEDEYNKYCSDLIKNLTDIEVILKRSKENFNSRMIL